MATGAPGNSFNSWRPTPPERGSFPLDHYGECKEQMMKYLNCMKFTENQNAPNCRILAKNYLKCRIDNELMEDSDWESLGLANLPDSVQGTGAPSTTRAANKTTDHNEKDT